MSEKPRPTGKSLYESAVQWFHTCITGIAPACSKTMTTRQHDTQILLSDASHCFSVLLPRMHVDRVPQSFSINDLGSGIMVHSVQEQRFIMVSLILQRDYMKKMMSSCGTCTENITNLSTLRRNLSDATCQRPLTVSSLALPATCMYPTMNRREKRKRKKERENDTRTIAAHGTRKPYSPGSPLDTFVSPDYGSLASPDSIEARPTDQDTVPIVRHDRKTIVQQEYYPSTVH